MKHYIKNNFSAEKDTRSWLLKRYSQGKQKSIFDLPVIGMYMVWTNICLHKTFVYPGLVTLILSLQWQM